MLLPQIAALVVFVVTIIVVIGFVLYPQQLRIPCTTWRLPVKYSIMPVLGSLLMLAFGSLTWTGVLRGIVGDEHIRPYGIAILFMSLAYMSSSLDSTGAFAWLALLITRASGGHGRRLFILYFALSSVITLFTSNDIVIMTLTPIIMYFSAATGVDPIPFLAAEFTAANIWSMAIFIGNPTNIIVADAYNMTFVGYTKWMGLPTIAAGAVCLMVLLLIHGRRIPQRLTIPAVNPRTMLCDTPGAVFGTVNVLGCLGLLAAAPTLNWPLWVVTLACAGLHLSYNFMAYVVLQRGVPAALEARRSSRSSSTPISSAHGDGNSLYKATGEAGKLACELAGGPKPASTAVGQAAPELSPHSSSEHHSVLVVMEPSSAGAGGSQPVAGNSSSSSLCGYSLQQQGAAQPEECSAVPRQQLQHAEVQQQQQQQEGVLHQAEAQQQQQQQQQQWRRAPTGPCTAAAGDAPCRDPHAAGQTRTSLDAISAARDCCKGVQASAAPAEVGEKGTATPAPCDLGGSQLQGHAPPTAAAAAATPDAAISSGVCDAPQQQAPVLQGTLTVQRPSFWRGLWQQPWEVVPFVLGMFVMVEGLAATGWLELAGRWLAACSRGHMGAALFSVGGVSLLLGNLMNNQPMTILMTRVLLSSTYEEGVPEPRMRQGAAFALLVASNLAANFTLLGSLAGIMWVNILRRQGLTGFGYLQFLRLMAPVGVACSVATLLVLWAQLAWFP